MAHSLTTGNEMCYEAGIIAPIDITATPFVGEATETDALGDGILAEPAAMVSFTLFDHVFSTSCKLGILDEYPEALKAITAHPCLTTSAFLDSALDAVMIDLRPAIMVPIAVRLAVVALKLAIGILPSNSQLSAAEDNEDEELAMADFIHDMLDHAVPYFQWQRTRHFAGRIRYLMILLQEAVRVMAVSTELLSNALHADASAQRASLRLTDLIIGLGESPVEICGDWASMLLSSIVSPRITDRPSHRPEAGRADPSKPTVERLEFTDDTDDTYHFPSPRQLVRASRRGKAATTARDLNRKRALQPGSSRNVRCMSPTPDPMLEVSLASVLSYRRRYVRHAQDPPAVEESLNTVIDIVPEKQIALAFVSVKELQKIFEEWHRDDAQYVANGSAHDNAVTGQHSSHTSAFSLTKLQSTAILE